jgi:hypothetical protein
MSEHFTLVEEGTLCDTCGVYVGDLPNGSSGYPISCEGCDE